MKTLSLSFPFLEETREVTRKLSRAREVLVPKGTALKTLFFGAKPTGKEELLVITSYPPKGQIHGAGVGGLAPFSKYTLLSLSKAAPDLKITVLAEKHACSHVTRDGKRVCEVANCSHANRLVDEYKDKNIRVRCVWEKGSFLTFPKLLQEILITHRAQKKVMLEFEFAMFGDIFRLLPLPLFLIILKLFRREVSIVFHQVIPDVNQLSGHINLEPDSITIAVFNIGFSLFYRLALMIADNIIVFDAILKDRLAQYGSKRKISIIPLGVEKFTALPTKAVARKKLKIKQNEFVILCFGFLAWYKGTDWIVNALDQSQKTIAGKKIKLILAGGENPNLVNKEYYRRYVENIERVCRNNEFEVTGFIPEKDIPYYYQSADLVIFPYRALMSASGPLSLSFSFKKPFLISENIRDWFKTPDIQEIMDELRLSPETISFGTRDNITKKIQKLITSNPLQKKVFRLSSSVARARSWDVIGAKYYETLF